MNNKKNHFVVYIKPDAFSEKELLELLKKGIVPNDAISWAAENGYVELTRKLIDAGANVIENQNYPLELASRNGHTSIVKMLLEAGAKPSNSVKSKDYCLRMAAWHGHKRIVKNLLNAGADPTLNNYSALKLALNNNHMEIVELLLDEIFKRKNNS